MKYQNLILFSMILLVAVSGCTVNIDLDDNQQVSNNESQLNNTIIDSENGDLNNLENNTIIDLGNNIITDLGNNSTSNNTVIDLENENETVIDLGNNSTGNNTVIVSNDTTSNNTVIVENLYEDVECAALNDVQLNLSVNLQDSEVTAKQVSMCSVNHDIMNGINYKYYTFTLTSPAKVYLLIDGFENGAWQVGIIGQGFEDGTNGEAVKYHAELPNGTYIIQVRPINSLGSTCTQSADEIQPCYFEFSNDETKWWVQGDEAGTAKLGFRLTLSTSEIQPNNTIEFGTASMVPITQVCNSFNSESLNSNIPNDETQYAYSVSLCDEVNDVYTSAAYEYYSISLSQETTVKFTLTKPEGAWQIGVNNYGWENSLTMGQEDVIYNELLPAGNHVVWVRVTNTAGLSGDDWSCRQIVTDGICYWLEGIPPTGVNYLNFKVSFDSE
ncbi:MAG: hypothetical protein PHN56_03550 [Candidatus Nanoarchaeia archaeon]|nr:hypothetical protein [Candidatus Nanoarchaeia archaeon]